MNRGNVLVTGPPGIGKSTVIEKLLQRLGLPATGFFTREIREQGRRVGFSILTCDGRAGVLAHVNIKSAHRVGRYGINLEALDRLAVPSMVPQTSKQVVVIDEIGKMECFSKLFREAVVRALDAENRVIGSISMKGESFIQNVKARPDVLLVKVSEENRDSLVPYLLEALS
ncbi:MAG: NTPase [Deltaproteobacteria bacterium]|nr:NTPase [Deltaproteobacteria bacterium]